MQNGRVTLIADNVPLRQILPEWARVGQTKIVNGDKLSGPRHAAAGRRARAGRARHPAALRERLRRGAAPGAGRERGLLRPHHDPRDEPRARGHAGAAPPPTFQRPPCAERRQDEPINVDAAGGCQGPQARRPNAQACPERQFPGMPPARRDAAQPSNQVRCSPAAAAAASPVMSPGPAPCRSRHDAGPNVPNPYQPVRTRTRRARARRAPPGSPQLPNRARGGRTGLRSLGSKR